MSVAVDGVADSANGDGATAVLLEVNVNGFASTLAANGDGAAAFDALKANGLGGFVTLLVNGLHTAALSPTCVFVVDGGNDMLVCRC